MSYKSARIITGLAAGMLLVGAYIVYALGRGPAESLQSWAIAILVFVGGSVVALIVIQILFHVAMSVGIAVRERDGDGAKIKRITESAMVEDERDRLIDLIFARVVLICAGSGAVVTLAMLAFAVSTVIALHVLIGAFVVGAFAGSIVSIRLYEGGVHSG